MWDVGLGKYKLDFRKILHLDDEPHKIAGGFAIGVFVSFSPFYGAHMVLALALAFLFRLNKGTALAGTWVVLPWFIPLVLSLSYLLGRFMLGQGFGIPCNPCFEREWIVRNFMPLLLGCSLTGALASAVSYVLVRRAVEVWRRGRHQQGSPVSEGNETSPPSRR
jgi:uncharacterized protein